MGYLAVAKKSKGGHERLGTGVYMGRLKGKEQVVGNDGDLNGRKSWTEAWPLETGGMGSRIHVSGLQRSLYHGNMEFPGT